MYFFAIGLHAVQKIVGTRFEYPLFVVYISLVRMEDHQDHLRALLVPQAVVLVAADMSA